jgi:hypothetical protein
MTTDTEDNAGLMEAIDLLEQVVHTVKYVIDHGGDPYDPESLCGDLIAVSLPNMPEGKHVHDDREFSKNHLTRPFRQAAELLRTAGSRPYG